MDFRGAWAELTQGLVRFLSVRIAALRQRTFPFLRVLLQHRRVGLLGDRRSYRGTEKHSEDKQAADAHGSKEYQHPTPNSQFRTPNGWFEAAE